MSQYYTSGETKNLKSISIRLTETSKYSLEP